MKHPADMTPDEKRYYLMGYTAADELLMRMGTQDAALYVHGIQARIEEENWKLLHPGHRAEKSA